MALGVDGIRGLPAVATGRALSVVDSRQLQDRSADGARPEPQRPPAPQRPALATGAADFPVRSAFARDAGGFLAQTIAQEVLGLLPQGPGPDSAAATYRAAPAGLGADTLIVPSARVDETA